MLAFWVSPTMGNAVSRGVLGTKELEAPNGAGLLSARNGVRPVAVGPVDLGQSLGAVVIKRVNRTSI